MQRSATTLKRLTGEVNNIEPLITMQCSLGNPWVRAFKWMPHWHAPTTQTLSQVKYTLFGNGTPGWQWPLLAGCVPPHYCSGMAHNKDLKVSTWPPNSPEPNPIEHLWDVPDLALTCGHMDTATGGGCPVVSGTGALVVDPLDPLKVCRCHEVVCLICDSVWVVRVKLAST